MPEVAFDWDSFLGDVSRVMDEHGRCLVAVSEGIHDSAGALIARGGETDAFGNVQLSGSGALGDQLASRVRQELSGARVRADTYGYLQRSFFGVVAEQDALEAREVGRAAVNAAVSGEHASGSLVIRRRGEGASYAPAYEVAPLAAVAGKTRVMPPEFLAGTNGVTAAFRDWAAPLVGTLPVPGRLSDFPVPRRL